MTEKEILNYNDGIIKKSVGQNGR